MDSVLNYGCLTKALLLLRRDCHSLFSTPVSDSETQIKGLSLPVTIQPFELDPSAPNWTGMSLCWKHVGIVRAIRRNNRVGDIHLVSITLILGWRETKSPQQKNQRYLVQGPGAPWKRGNGSCKDKEQD